MRFLRCEEIQSIIDREQARQATLEAEAQAVKDAQQREDDAKELQQEVELKLRLVKVAKEEYEKTKIRKRQEKGKKGEPSVQEKLDAAEQAHRDAIEAQANAEDVARKARAAVVEAEKLREEAAEEQEKREGPVKQLKAQIMSALEERFLDKDGDGELDAGALVP